MAKEMPVKEWLAIRKKAGRKIDSELRASWWDTLGRKPNDPVE